MPDWYMCLDSRPPLPEANTRVPCFPKEKPEKCPEDSWASWVKKYDPQDPQSIIPPADGDFPLADWPYECGHYDQMLAPP